MEREWPLVGRAAELTRVGELVGSGAGGVVLAGPAGVGKTRLAAECLAMGAERGFVPLRVAGTQAASALPFGAFASLVPDLVGGIDRADVLRHVAAAVLARGEGKPVILFVDDAHVLDESSAALTHHLAASRETFLLATLRTGEPACDAVLALWKDGLVERLEVGVLSLTEVEELLATVLGGPLDGATVRTFFERSQGNVLFLKELVLGADGLLRSDGGMWRLEGRLPPSDRLVELVEARLAGLPDDDRGTLEVLALGEPLGVDLLQGNVERLERRALLQTNKIGRRLEVRLAHPLYGDVLRARLSPLRTRSLCRWLAGALETAGARRREDTLRMATWSLHGGGEVRPDLMLAAGQQAGSLFDFELAERLVRAATDGGAGFEAELFLGHLLFLMGRYRDADDHLGAVARRADNDRDRTRVARLRIDTLTWAGRVEEAMVVLLEAEAVVTEPRWIEELTVKRGLFAFFGGFTDIAIELLEPLLDRLSGDALVEACFVAAYALSQHGRIADAIATCQRGSTSQRSLGTFHQGYAMAHARALVWAGRFAEAEALGTDRYDEAVAKEASESQCWFAATLTYGFLAQGRAASAIRRAQETVALARPLSRAIYMRNALSNLAHSLALTGRADEAQSFVDEIDALPAIGWEEAEVCRTRAWVAIARGDLVAARGRLEEAVATASRAGDLVFESAALHDLARLGHAPQVARRLAELAQIIEGPLAPTRAAHAAALVAQDPAGLEAASLAFETIEGFLLAAEAAADAAVAWRKAGESRKAAAAERRAHALAERCEGARTPALTAVTARAALTSRELEIARLAAAGVPNKEIAARLFLSPRTVENKLHATYEKLGIDGRAQLPEVLAGYQCTP